MIENLTPEEEAEMSKRIAEAIKNWKQPILQHQHTYQVQVSDHVIVRWCVGCGMAHKVEHCSNAFYGDYWEPILEREDSAASQ